MSRIYTPIDRLIIGIDSALRMATGQTNEAQRDNPADSVPEIVMEEEQRRHAAGLMHAIRMSRPTCNRRPMRKLTI